MLRLEIGEDLLALVAAQRPRTREMFFRIAQMREQRRAPRDGIGLEDRELFGRGIAVDLGIDVHVELPGRERRRRRRSCHRSPLLRRRTQRAPSKNAGPKARPVPATPCGGPRLGSQPFRVDGLSTAVNGTAVALIVSEFSMPHGHRADLVQRTRFSRRCRASL